MNQTTNLNVLNAGRELDALVAEKVMGMRSAGDDPGLQYGIEGPMWRDAEERYAFQRLPDFSTDISAAWQVAQRALAVEVAYDSDPSRWRCYIDFGHARFATCRDQPSAPLAICKAALAAMADAPEHERDE